MKKKFYVVSLLIFSIFNLFIPFSNVYAATYLFPETNLIPTEYDEDISIFDKYGYDLPQCTTKIYINKDDSTPGYTRYYFNTSSVNSIDTLCNKDYAPDLAKIKKYFKFYTRLTYYNKVSNKEYDLFIIHSYYTSTGNKEDGLAPRYPSGSSNSDFHHTNFLAGTNLLISALPNDLLLSSPSLYANNKQVDSSYNYWSFNFDMGYGTRQVFTQNGYSLNFNLNQFLNGNFYFNNTITTNYDLYYDNGTQITSATLGPEFGTDLDLIVPIEHYALLIPKKNYSFSTYIWTDNNFLYQLSSSNCVDDYIPISGGALDEISFAALNGFNWARWTFDFSQDDIDSNMVLQIYNHGSSDLKLKVKSEDFYYYILDKNSSGINVNNCSYSNNFEYLKEIASHHVINNVYDIDEFNNGLSFLNSLPNLLSAFTKSFIFIGTLISSAFSIFSNEIVIYFYILFGIMIIMLIVNIMK